MINRLCKRLNQNIEVRQSLSSLRQEIKDSSKRELLLSWICLLYTSLDLDDGCTGCHH